jgi:hypothetical protein
MIPYGSRLQEVYLIVAKGVTFTVTYALATGLFTITPSSGEIRYLNVNDATTVSYRDSIAGITLGLTATTALAATVVSDTPVYGLGTEAHFINTTSSTLEHYHDDKHKLFVDQALHIVVGTAPLTATYSVLYEDVV